MATGDAKDSGSDECADDQVDSVRGHMCDPCNRADRRSPATVFCKTCDGHLCSDCCVQHITSAIDKHQIIDIGDQIQEDATAGNKTLDFDVGNRAPPHPPLGAPPPPAFTSSFSRVHPPRPTPFFLSAPHYPRFFSSMPPPPQGLLLQTPTHTPQEILLRQKKFLLLVIFSLALLLLLLFLFFAS